MPPWIALPDVAIHLTILFAIPFLAYWHVLFHGGWASDDCIPEVSEEPAIAYYRGKLQRPVRWGSLCKWARYYLARLPNPNRKWKEQNQPAYLPSPCAHHRLNLWWLGGVSGLAYLFLCHVVHPATAFLTALLFALHPLGTQVTAWVSGINYLLGAFFMLLGLNLVLLSSALGWLGSPLAVLLILLGYAACQWMAAESMFQMAGVVAILCWFQAWPFALVALLMSLWQCSNTFREAVTLRRKVFHEQQMGAATKVHWRKVYVICKTFYYNMKLSFFPKRLGLYSDFLYDYPLPWVEAENRHFWAGFALILSCLGGWCTGLPVVQLSILWFVVFIVIFSGIIIVNQVVVDRYVWMPTLGTCLLMTWLCVTRHWMPLYYVVVGVALMRTWAHVPTYDGEEQFYLSNTWNFPRSEVAYGNLGAYYSKMGWVGSSIDAWWRGIQLNSEYDVCWYNLALAYIGRGPQNPSFAPLFYNSLPQDVVQQAMVKDPTRHHLHVARYCLQRAVTAKTCHFPSLWQEQLLQLDRELARPVGVPPLVARLIQPMLVASVT